MNSALLERTPHSDDVKVRGMFLVLSSLQWSLMEMQHGIDCPNRYINEGWDGIVFAVPWSYMIHGGGVLVCDVSNGQSRSLARGQPRSVATATASSSRTLNQCPTV